MLRTKSSTDAEGRPILVLPPAQVEVLYCELSAAEKDFYEALFKRSKVKFDMFVEQGRVLHNYASILELLLRLRQCCDHPFLVMSRGDTRVLRPQQTCKTFSERKIINKPDLITAPTDCRFQIDVEKNWVESSKVSVLLQELDKLRPLGAKSIIF
nr:PREDICTED: putative SWI/SNF-related matrix-associated actin-dependent regulator of chromatin subfamily A member 3-like 2 [Musa acuminata subsp. malaccensis]